MCCVKCRRTRYNLRDKKKNSSTLELGTVKRTGPVIGGMPLTPHNMYPITRFLFHPSLSLPLPPSFLPLAKQYRALHNYVPQTEGDLALTKGDWITLIEAPYGGDWWRGSVGEEVGWFPKTYVEYVDVEAEKKRLQEGEGVRDACVIGEVVRGHMV